MQNLGLPATYQDDLANMIRYAVAERYNRLRDQATRLATRIATEEAGDGAPEQARIDALLKLIVDEALAASDQWNAAYNPEAVVEPDAAEDINAGGPPMPPRPDPNANVARGPAAQVPKSASNFNPDSLQLSIDKMIEFLKSDDEQEAYEIALDQARDMRAAGLTTQSESDVAKALLAKAKQKHAKQQEMARRLQEAEADRLAQIAEHEQAVAEDNGDAASVSTMQRVQNERETEQGQDTQDTQEEREARTREATEAAELAVELPAHFWDDPDFARAAQDFTIARAANDKAGQKKALKKAVVAAQAVVADVGGTPVTAQQILQNILPADQWPHAVQTEAPDTPTPPDDNDSVEEYATLRRMQREAEDEENAPDFSAALDAISAHLINRDGDSARAAAIRLAEDMGTAGGRYAGWTAADILKFVMKRNKDAAVQTAPEDDDPDGLLPDDGTELTLRHVSGVDWGTVIKLYEIDKDEEDEMVSIAKRLVKKGPDDGGSRKAAKDLVARGKKKKKKPKLKNHHHLIAALLDAIRRKAKKKKVTKPLKPSDIPDEDDQDKAA